MGLLVAIEGIDGAGKGTQTEMLRRRAEAEGMACEVFSFPQYGENAFAEGVSQYLNGAFGPVDSVPSQLAALLYAGDRYATRSKLLAALAAKDLVVCDRYVASNMAHQAAKLPDDMRGAFMEWLAAIEFEIYAMPKPDVTFLLDMPTDLARRLVRKKQQRGYTQLTEDIHEADASFLSRSRTVFRQLALEQNGGVWHVIDCSDENEEPLPANAVAGQVWAFMQAQ